MRLSDEQMAAVHGSEKSVVWRVIEMPVGRTEIPEWAKGLHIDWCSGVANAPRFLLKTDRNIGEWEPQIYEKVGADMYLTESGDGRAKAHYHNGAVRLTKLRAPRHSPYVKDRPEVEVMATTKQNGYGGSRFWIKTREGDLVLRGPWHGGPPPGYVEVTVIDMTSQYNKPNPRRPRPWYRNGGTFGTCISEELLVKLIARYQPHVEVIQIERAYGVRIEVKKAEWHAPKIVMYEEERMRAVNKQPASKFWRIYWDARGTHCGTLRKPMYGYEEGVTDVI